MEMRREGAPIPATGELGHLIRTSAELRSEWRNILPELLAWVNQLVPQPPDLSPVPVPVASEAVAPRRLRYWGMGVPLEVVRFAGANRLLIEFTYHGRRGVQHDRDGIRAGDGCAVRASLLGRVHRVRLAICAWES